MSADVSAVTVPVVPAPSAPSIIGLNVASGSMARNVVRSTGELPCLAAMTTTVELVRPLASSLLQHRLDLSVDVLHRLQRARRDLAG